MTTIIDSKIKEFQRLIVSLHTQFDEINKTLKKIPTDNNPELADEIAAFNLQYQYTISTDNLLKTVVPLDTPATLAHLTTAINLIQLYFQGTQSLSSILADLLNSLTPIDGIDDAINIIRKSVNQIAIDRTTLQKTLNRVLREFDSEISDLNLKSLLQRIRGILSTLDRFIQNPPIKLNVLSPVIDDLIDHLKTAQALFKSFNRKGDDLTGDEPDEIKQLILNWGEAIRKIETLEATDSIKNDLNDGTKAGAAIAQSIQLHELLESNYDYLTALIRSGDLESAGIL